ncbi:hypothetical protein [Burkholderia sp. RF2-non_BP3]|uniref:hypothetical protein n=1 Tax=Burkholderia sp. RF2-non_BP3 TaxID=1637844 RepID=UPI000755A1DB|nr:hypothetical protein [Burkholderia sp. RF2-non_BP3]KUY52380.1 hypothetical protein WS45_25000 [Burkholderia sp. RF2-non_BP3]
MSKPHEVRAHVTRLVELELARCRSELGPESWATHQEWVTENVVASAKQWLAQQAAEGRL